MDSRLIIIQGYLASGKSTFAVRLSKELGVPYLVKDTFKSAMCKGIDIDSRAESSRFSAVVFDAMMYVAERLIETGMPLIIEGNFVPEGIKKADEAGVINELISLYSCKTLLFKFWGNTRVLYSRFVERENTPERGDANRLYTEISYPDFDKSCRALDAFSVGNEIITVDTTDFTTVNYNSLIASAQQFISQI